ncbi:Squalene/phytoene synthase [Tricharina praecox]|uniref:Squalene/phytoene synthase n=1 Tax=Tricharina praecox TaxID=43433 RepID=UPI00221F6309|nr:Squalene/phytoene synthase [Tricharina praecox]KAI5845526.1 Squalene/phytoene synthase [Tricharina praecox]
MPPARLLSRAPSLLRSAPRRLASTSTRTSPSPPKLTTASARTHCLSLLRHSDHSAYILSTFQPPSARDAFIALRAFNLELSSVDSVTSNVAVGRLRLQFWRESISAVLSPISSARGVVPAEPVTALLYNSLHTDGAKLSKSFLHRVIAAREAYLGAAPFATLGDLEAYAENTYGSLQYLNLEACKQRNTALDHVGSHVGKAEGVVAVLRGVPLLAASGAGGGGAGGSGGGGQGAVVLPLDVCAEFGLRQEDVLRRGGDAPGLKDAVFKVATLANDHLITARKMLDDAGEAASGAAFASFLPAVPTTLYLERLEKADFNPFAPALMRRQWTLPWRAYRAYTTKKF